VAQGSRPLSVAAASARFWRFGHWVAEVSRPMLATLWYSLACGNETPPLATTTRYSCSDWAIPLSAKFVGG
jgi:hypothetical protein